MRRHLWHASILTTLTLLQTLVVECLLLLLLCHVATMLRCTRHAGLCGRHCGDVLWGVRYVAGIDTILVASRLGRVQTSLRARCKQMEENATTEVSYLDEVFAFRFCDKWL